MQLIHELEQKFTSVKTKRTDAPKPLETVSGTPEAVESKDGTDIKSDEAWYNWYNNQKRKSLEKKFG